MENRTYRVGIIGCGGIAQVHIAVLQQMSDIEIAAVCDIRPDRLEKAVQKTGAKGYENWRDVVAQSDIDVIHICLPHYLHAPVAIEALNAGKNVITEKPMATTLADARAMIEASEREGAGTLGVVFQNRYNPAVLHAKRLVDSGELGAFKGMNASVCWTRDLSYYHDSGWRGVKATEGAGTLINQSIHTLDLLSYIGGPIERVRGAIFTGLFEGQIEVEDNSMAVALYENGARALVHTSNNNVADAPVQIDIYMEKGALKLYGPKLYRMNDDETLTLIDAGDGKVALGKSYWGTGHIAQFEDYYQCLREGKHFWLDGRSGFGALALVMGIITSSDEGRWVTLEKA